MLDTNLTPALIDEGFVRELVSKIQTMRKDSGFEVTDHIRVGLCGNEKLETLIRKDEAALLGDVLGDAVCYGKPLTFAKEWNINGETVTLSVEKV